MVFMSLKASRRFPKGFVLLRDGAAVGWLRAGIIGFGSFDDRAEAQRAGERAAFALAQWYRTRWRSRPIGWEAEVRIDDRISVDETVVGRICAEDPMGVLGDSQCGIELRIPDETWIAVMLELAQRMYMAMNATELAS
jgi:hypothetical protein